MPTTEVNGLNLFYRDEGQGPPLVFIHPPVITSVCFARQLENLKDICRCVAFDIRGHGYSAESTQPVTYTVTARDLVGLLDVLGLEQAVLCGYSTGAGIALEVMLSYPNRVRAAILVSGMSEVSDWYLQAEIQLGAVLARLNAVNMLAYGLARGNAGDKSLCTAMYEAGRRGRAKNIEEYFHASLKYNCTARLPEVTKPTLIVCGKQDRRFVGFARTMHEGLSHSHLSIISGVSHRLPGRAPKALNEQIRTFLSELGMM